MSKNILDSRKLQERLDELQSDFTNWKENLSPEQISKIRGKYEISDSEEIPDEELGWEWEDEVGSDADELKNLVELRDEINSSEWTHGLQLIADSYFETYAREFAEDIGAISGDERWPATCIDWEKAASELQYDYSSVEFDGETYWYRE